MGVAPQLQPLEGMLLRRSTDIYPKELARDMCEFFNSLLGECSPEVLPRKVPAAAPKPHTLALSKRNRF